jgi:hypothetical protein
MLMLQALHHGHQALGAGRACQGLPDIWLLLLLLARLLHLAQPR